MDGFEVYVMDNTKITCPDLTEYFEGKNKSYADYFPYSMRIRKAIRAEQIDGGMTNQYNASLTARINNIKEHTETTSTTSIKLLNIDPLDDSSDDSAKENISTKEED